MSTKPHNSELLQRKASLPTMPLKLGPKARSRLGTKTKVKSVNSLTSRPTHPLAILAAIRAAPNSGKPCRVELPLQSKKTVVFDLDETLVHCVSAQKRAEVTVHVPGLGKVGLNVRPHAQACLKEASSRFEVLVFTASKRAYADAILDYLDPKGDMVSHRLYRESCTVVNGQYVKDLSILNNRDLSQVVLIDNSVSSFAFQLNNGIPVRTWTNDKHDSELLRVVEYFTRIERAKDVREVNRAQFHLELRFQEYIRTQQYVYKRYA